MNTNDYCAQVVVRVTEFDKNALKVAKSQENAKKRNGFRWFKINDRTRVFVECDKDGNPTKQGREQINNVLEKI